MIHLIGVVCSCLVQDYVFFGIMNTLYEKKYNNNNLPYIGAFILYAVLGSVVTWTRFPVLNLVYSMVVLCLLSYFLYKPKVKNMIMNSGIVIIYLILVDLAITTVFSTFTTNSMFKDVTNPSFFLITSMGDVIVLLCTWNLLARLIIGFHIEKITKHLYFYMFFLMIFEVGIICYFVKGDTNVERNIPLLVICLGFVIMDYGVLYLYKMYSKTAMLERQADLLEQQQEMTIKYFTGLLENYDETQKVLHDMKKHLKIIGELGQSGELEKEYAKELLDSIVSVQPHFQCTDRIICAILWDKIQTCKRYNISFDINMQDIEFSFMNKIEVTTLFTNLLDNAVEACQNSKAKKKEINLRIHRFKNYIVINVRNTIGIEPVIKEGALISTKPGHLGMGMMILANLADKYCGNLDFDKTESFFETKIILYANNKA